jgi:hypothetical protein
MDFAALRRWWPLAAVLGLLFVISLAATRSAPQLDQIQPDSTPTTRPPLLPPEPSARPAIEETVLEPAQGLPDWVGTATLVILIAGAVLMVAGLTWALVRDHLRRRPARAGRHQPRRTARTADDLVAALDAGLEELSDTDRDPGDSPTDYVGRLLAEQRVDAGVLAALLAVYREARYATHTVDDQMRQQARSALERLRADLGATRTGAAT